MSIKSFVRANPLFSFKSWLWPNSRSLSARNYIRAERRLGTLLFGSFIGPLELGHNLPASHHQPHPLRWSTFPFYNKGTEECKTTGGWDPTLPGLFFFRTNKGIILSAGFFIYLLFYFKVTHFILFRDLHQHLKV